MISKRVVAFLLDIHILFLILAPSGYLIQRLTGYRPRTGPAIWSFILWSFSLPAWLYFAWSDRSKKGKSIGKKVFKLRVVGKSKKRLGWGRAMIRTAVKLLPWEIIHFFSFALSKDLVTFTPVQYIGLVAGNALAFVYFIACVLTQGERSIHDFLAGTAIQFDSLERPQML